MSTDSHPTEPGPTEPGPTEPGPIESAPTEPGPTEPGPAATALHAAWSGEPSSAPVVLVHGSMDRSAGMLRLSRRLDSSFHVLRYDRRGYGRSASCPPPFDVAAHVEDLDLLVIEAAERHGGPVRLFGHSFGGNVVLAVAARRPDAVATVAVYEMPLPWTSWWPSNTAGAAARGHDDPADAAETFMRRLVGDAVWERVPVATRLARRREGAAMVAELTSLGEGSPWDPDALTQPVLAMVGERARPQHRRGMNHVRDAIATAHLVTIAEAGHAAPNTHPDVLATVLTDAWLSGPADG